MNTIGDMQNEMYFYGHYNMFEYNQGFFETFMKNWRCKGGAPNLR